MTEESASASPTFRTRISTGYGRLDEALQGGFLTGSMVVLNAPASDEVPLLVRDFLQATHEESLLICRTVSSAQTIAHDAPEHVKSLVCSDKPVSPDRNVIPGKGVDNLTELNFQIADAIGSVQPKRVAIDILSDILLRHKALQTRKWLREFLEKLRSKNITTLAVMNPNMHTKEEAEAVLDLFDGNLEIFEKDVEGTLRKFLRIKWMHGLEAAEKELLLLDLTAERLEPPKQAAVAVTPFKKPRWLTSLVGRTTELSKLKSTFENALARASVAALQGEAGVGKTRLMQELGVYAQSKGAVVLTGSASEAGLPYAPWIEVARQYVAVVSGEVLRRMLGPHASGFVRLVPDIAAKVGTIPPSKPLGEEQDKIRLYEAVTQFLISICSMSPLLLLFDDMHWADQSSLDLLEYLVRSTGNLRIMTVSSNRMEEIQPDSPINKTLMKFNRQRLLETIQVKNLNKEETTELIKQTFGEQTISSEFADLIHQRTGGNPFFVEEVLRSLVEEGLIFRTEKGWDRKPIQEIVLPESVKSVLRSRLTKLGPETLNVLTMASVIGSEFDFEVLREVTQTQEDMLLDRLEKAITAGLILEVPKRKDVFKFADNRTRDALLDEIIQSRRIRYHVKIAEAMLKVYSKNLESQAAVISNHFSEGGDTERTIRYSIMAGDREMAIHAYEQAISNYRRALDLVNLESSKDEQKATILEKLAGSYFSSGRFQNSVQHYEQALAVFEKLHNLNACARICLGLSMSVLWVRGGYRGVPDLVLVLKRGLRYLEGDLQSFLAARIYSRLALNLAAVDQWDEANTWAEKAREAGEKSENFAAVAEALSVKGFYQLDTGQIDEGLPVLEKAFDLALQHEEYAQANRYLLNLTMYTYPRDLARARELALRNIELSARVSDVASEAEGLAFLSYLDWLRGDWTNALVEVNKALEISERLEFRISTYGVRGSFSLVVGDLEQAEAYLQATLSFQDPKISSIVGVNLGLGKLRLEQGAEEQAEAHFETAVNAFKDWEYSTFPLWHIETLLHLTSIYVGRNELEKARSASQWAMRLAQQLRSDAGLAMASQAEANFLLASGDKKGAEEYYSKSLTLWEKAGWPYYQAKALLAYSGAIAQTNPNESKKRLEQASEIFKKLAAKRDLEKVQARLREQGVSA